MATRVVSALFDDRMQAERAVQSLLDAGFARSDISVTLRDRGESREFAEEHGTKAAEGAGAGAVTGGVLGGLGGLLVGAGLLAIPGIGPILAAGQLAAVVGSTAAIAGATAAGAGIGAATGGLIGALVGMGVPDEHAHVYAEGVRRGGVLLLVNAEDESRYSLAESMLRQSGAVDVNARRADYERTGWRGFDEKAEPWDDSDRRVATTGTTFDDQYTNRDGMARTGQDTVSGTTQYVAGSEGMTRSNDATWAASRDERSVDTLSDEERLRTARTTGDVDDRGVRISGSGDNRYGNEPIITGREGVGPSGTNPDLEGSRGDWAGNDQRDGAINRSDGNESVDRGDWERSSKAGTAGGGVAGAVTGAAIGSVAGPVGTVVGGVAGAVTGAGVGGAADAAATEATDEDGRRRDEAYGAGTAGGPTTSVLGGTAGTAHTVDRSDDERLRDERLRDEEDLDNPRM
jgi:hypothetical protein